MAFIGNTVQTQGFTPAVDYFSGNGVTVTFTLSRPVASVAQVQVTIENVPQNPSSSFTVSGSTITFTSAPPSGTSNIYVQYTSIITQTLIAAAGGTGTVTAVAALTLGTTGTDLTSTVANASTTPVITLNVPTASSANRGALSAADWSTFNGKGTGTVTTVGFTGGIISVATATSTPALTIAGTSGGIPYFSSGTTWATSAALASGALVQGGGAGVAPSTITTGTGVVTALGVNTGSAGAFITFNGALGTPSSGTVTNLTGTASININGTVGATTPTTGAFTTVAHSAGTTAIAPITLTSGTNLTTAVAGAAEYDGTNLYFTQDTTQGRGVVPTSQQFYLSSAGTAFGATIAPFFGANSAISLDASSTYYIEAYCYFLKTTAGTATWTHTISSAATLAHAIIEYTPVTGFTTTIITGSMVTTEATQQTSTALVHTATSSLTTAVYHIAKFTTRITTNAACNYRLNLTQSAGTVTPQAGSYYKITRVGGTAGNFVA